MTKQYEVKGAVTLSVATPAAGSLEELGLTVNGVDITEEVFTGRVDVDTFGGEEGPPGDMQYFGEVHVIQFTLSKFDAAVYNKIRAGLAGGAAGTPGTAGTLFMQQGKTWRLLLNSVGEVRNYTNVIFHRPKSAGIGTKYQRPQIVAEAHVNQSTGLLYNTSTS